MKGWIFEDSDIFFGRGHIIISNHNIILEFIIFRTYKIRYDK